MSLVERLRAMALDSIGHEAADEIKRLEKLTYRQSNRIDDLASEVEAQRTRADHYAMLVQGAVDENERLRNELDAAQAREAKLRGAFESLHVYAKQTGTKWLELETGGELELPTDDTALRERLTAERERCAKVCDDLIPADESGVREDSYRETAVRCAAAIRARHAMTVLR